MDLEQSVKNLQAQNIWFQVSILNLAKGQDELKNLVNPEEKGSAYTAKFIPWHMPLSQVLQQLLNQSLITLVPPYPVSANPAPRYKYNARCAYHSNITSHDTEDCGPLKHEIQDLIDEKIIDFSLPEKSHETSVVYNQRIRNKNGRNRSVGAFPISTPAPQQPRKQGAPKRQVTKINMTLAEALQQLLKEGIIVLKDPPQHINTSSAKHNPNVRCAYHSNSPGHDTNSCWALKNKIQDMIDADKIEFNPPKTPVVITAPMPSHDKTD